MTKQLIQKAKTWTCMKTDVSILQALEM